MNESITNIPINKIRIINPRHRDRRKFELIVQSIKNLGLKKPIQVSFRSKDESPDDGYDLVCGQGRLEAFQVLGYKEIPALIVSIPKEERLLRSLVENIARRPARPTELLQEIERLKAQGYSNVIIGKKLDLNDTIVGGYLALKKAGEERLLEYALNGKIPVGVAMDIAKTDNADAQRALLKAYEDKELDQNAIRMVKRIFEHRRFMGKRRKSEKAPPKPRATAAGYVAAFKRESSRQRVIIKKAKVCDTRLVIVVSSFGRLLEDEDFVNLLRAESLLTMPKFLSDRLKSQQKEAA